MPSSDTARIKLLEDAFAALMRRFQDLRERLGRAEQLNPTAETTPDGSLTGGEEDGSEGSLTGGDS